MSAAFRAQSIALDLRDLQEDAGEVLASACYAATVTLGVAVLVSAAYLAKSALGINLLPGPSPLHDILFHFVR